MYVLRKSATRSRKPAESETLWRVGDLPPDSDTSLCVCEPRPRYDTYVPRTRSFKTGLLTDRSDGYAHASLS
eukprot:3739946-Prymnesium_polylepis.1